MNMLHENGFKEIARFSGETEAATIAAFLDQGNIRFRMVQLTQKSRPRSQPSDAGTVIQVLDEDFAMAEQLIASYRKVQGVPYS